MVETQDPETGEILLIDTASRRLREHFARQAAAEQDQIRTVLRRLKIDTLDLSTDRPYIDDVHWLFHQRQIRAGHG